MPTYEYICSGCSHKFERFESIIAAPNKLCPNCKKRKAVRQISGGGGFLFKGTGFYVTDYKKGSESKPSKPTDATAETKPANSGTGENKAEPAKPVKTETKTSSTKSETKSDSTKAT